MARKPRNLDELLPLLEKHEADIARNGSIEHRKTKNQPPYWVVRFRLKTETKGVYEQISISLGTDQKIADAVASFIADHRARRAKLRQERNRQQQLAREQRRQDRELLILYRIATGSSRRTMRRLKSVFSMGSSNDGRVDLMSYCQCPRPRPRGRPLKQRLW